MIDFDYQRRPCAECPWRLDVAPGAFPAARYRALAATAYDLAHKVFGCHKTPEGAAILCAGFLLRGADHNLTVRLERAAGAALEVQDGGHELFGSYREMATANGVRPGDPVLRPCRGAGE